MLRLLAYPFNRWFIILLLIINILGSGYGFYWYRFQLQETPWYYLLFVPDSPLSSTLFSLTLILILARRRQPWLELFACLWVIKYGVWAVIINADVGLRGQFTFENLMLAVSHLGMAIEGVIFLPHVRVSLRHAIVLGVWLILNDFLDYAVGVHPYLFDPGQLTLATWSAITLSVALILAAVALGLKRVHT
ncbi:MAG TPA: DUF1405 domain-containing protein [Desulfobacteria bacterium]|nr:DUF1405 domain-containing protein [Desulfobacteria bacterium]